MFFVSSNVSDMKTTLSAVPVFVLCFQQFIHHKDHTTSRTCSSNLSGMKTIPLAIHVYVRCFQQCVQHRDHTVRRACICYLFPSINPRYRPHCQLLNMFFVSSNLSTIKITPSVVPVYVLCFQLFVHHEDHAVSY